MDATLSIAEDEVVRGGDDALCAQRELARMSIAESANALQEAVRMRSSIRQLPVG